MKTVVIIGALGVSGYLLWLYYKQNKSSSGCGCGGHDQEDNGSEVAAPKAGAEIIAPIGTGANVDVARYQTSPLKTFNTPERLIVSAHWPTDAPQAFSRG